MQMKMKHEHSFTKERNKAGRFPPVASVSLNGHEGINQHGGRKGRHYYTHSTCEASYSSGDPCGRHVA